MLAGLAIGMGWFKSTIELLLLFVVIISFRMQSVYFKWKLPRRSLGIAAAHGQKKGEM
ncbi:putative membrane protein YeiH [Paenibacillus castaneae]|nr:putative membrane protein YeiH [Paenibacillus castaneae]